MSEAIAAVVFDLDGVLIDSESVWDAARREVVARNGGRWQADATRTMMGMSSPEWSRYLHDQLGVPLEPEQINELVVAALLDQYRRRLPLLPGAVAAVKRLADRWPLGLASSSNRPVIDYAASATFAGTFVLARFKPAVGLCSELRYYFHSIIPWVYFHFIPTIIKLPYLFVSYPPNAGQAPLWKHFHPINYVRRGVARELGTREVRDIDR